MKLSLIELLIKGIPEGFLDIWAMYIFTRTKLDKTAYITLSFIFIIATYCIRRLPINYGVNSMLSILLFIVLFVMVHKVEFRNAIRSAIIVMILLFISEGLNILLLTSVYGTTETKQLLITPLSKSIYSIPSTIIFALIILIFHLIISKISTNRKIGDGKISDQAGE